MPSASKGYFGLAEETVPGVAITTPEALLPVTSADFPFENEFIDIYEIRGSRQAYTVQDGPIRGSGSVSGAVYPSQGMAMILKGLLGGVESALVTPSTTAYEHAFTEGSGGLPYFTLERSDAFNGEGNVLSERLAGAKVESTSFNCSYGEQVDFSANFQSIKRPASGSPIARAAVPFPTQRALRFDGASIVVDGTPNSLFKSVSVEISNTLERQETLNGTNEAYKVFESGLNCTLSGSAVFEDMSLYNLLQNGTEFDVELEITNKVFADQTNSVVEGLRFVFPKVRLASHGTPFTANETVNADVQFRVIYDDASTSSCQVYMINTDDGTAY